MKYNHLGTAFALSAVVLITGCSEATSAAPASTPTASAAAQDAGMTATATATATPTLSPGAPTPPPVAGNAMSAEEIVYQQARTVVLDLAKGDKLSAVPLMTPMAAQEMKSKNPKDYLFGEGSGVKTCQVGGEMKLKDPTAANFGNAFTTPGLSKRADAKLTVVQVICDARSFGLVVSVVGPQGLVDGIYHQSDTDSRFVGNS